MGNDSFLAFVSLNVSAPAKTISPLMVPNDDSDNESSSFSFPSKTIVKYLKAIALCGKEVFPIVKQLYSAFNEYKKKTDEGKSNAKRILQEILQESIAKGTQCYIIIKEIADSSN